MWIMGVVMMTAMFLGLFDSDSWHRRGQGNRAPVHETMPMDQGHWMEPVHETVPMDNNQGIEK
ncbi:MAG: hypothetical protein U1C55_09820 [Smithellaceae bacterium]|nr:hypothetical protein [Smithellaceae bacterium]